MRPSHQVTAVAMMAEREWGDKEARYFPSMWETTQRPEMGRRYDTFHSVVHTLTNRAGTETPLLASTLIRLYFYEEVYLPMYDTFQCALRNLRCTKCS